MAATCKPKIVEDPSAFALASNEATMILGGCEKPLRKGYETCQIKQGADLPELNLFFVADSEWALSDCALNIYKTGSSVGGTLEKINLSGLKEQIEKYKFCLLRIEVIQKYPDPRDDTQFREIPLAGGFFIEVLPSGYFPVPDKKLFSWCYKVAQTNKGRVEIEACTK